MTVMIIQYRFGLSLIDNSTMCMMFNPRPVIPLVIAAARLLHHIVHSCVVFTKEGESSFTM